MVQLQRLIWGVVCVRIGSRVLLSIVLELNNFWIHSGILWYNNPACLKSRAVRSVGNTTAAMVKSRSSTDHKSSDTVGSLILPRSNRSIKIWVKTTAGTQRWQTPCSRWKWAAARTSLCSPQTSHFTVHLLQLVYNILTLRVRFTALLEASVLIETPF